MSHLGSGSLLAAGALVLVLSSCGGSTSDTASQEDRPLVVAAFYPIEFVVARVGGDAVRIESLTPTGVEPHDLELSSSQVVDITEADLVVYLGHGFQPAVEDAVGSLDEERRFDALEGKELLEGHEDEPADEGEHTDEEEHGEEDPHVWLDPSMLATIATEVAGRLSDLDPNNADLYRANAADLGKELGALDESFASGLQSCDSREFVTSHEAFGYLAARYDLEEVSVSGIDPEAEPSPQRLAEVARFVEDNDIKVIFFEELAPPALAETLARETGAMTDVLSPLETAPEEGDYLDEMDRNLQRLRSALGCD
jgi:zinc transport system substrate-binding protein